MQSQHNLCDGFSLSWASLSLSCGLNECVSSNACVACAVGDEYMQGREISSGESRDEFCVWQPTIEFHDTLNLRNVTDQIFPSSVKWRFPSFLSRHFRVYIAKDALIRMEYTDAYECYDDGCSSDHDSIECYDDGCSSDHDSIECYDDDDRIQAPTRSIECCAPTVAPTTTRSSAITTRSNATTTPVGV